jgi:hypothetical protein
LRAALAKLHQDPPFPTTPYLSAAPHIALLSRTRSNARATRPSYSISPPPAPLPDPPAPKSLPLPPPAVHARITAPIRALLLLFLSFLSSSFRRRFPAEPDTTVSNSIPSRGTRRPSALPFLAFRSTTPQEGWEQALLTTSPKGREHQVSL